MRLNVLAFIAGTSVGIWYFLPYLILDLKGGLIEVGLISTFPGLVAAITQLSLGTFIEETKITKDLLVLGFILSSLFAIPFLFASTSLIAILIATLIGPFNSITIIWGVANSLYMAELTPAKSRARIMSIYSTLWYLGNILGSYLAGYLAPISWSIVFIIFSGVNLMAGLFLKYYLPEVKLDVKVLNYWEIVSHIFNVRKFFKAFKNLPSLIKKSPKEYFYFCLALPIRSIGVSLVMPIIAYYLAKILQASKLVIATLTSFGTLARIVPSPLMGWIADRWGRKKVFSLGFILMMIYPLFFISVRDVNLLYPAYLMMGIGWACSQATYLAWLIELVPYQRGLFIGLLSFLNNLSWAIGPSIGGFFGEYVGIWWGVGAAILIEFIGFLLLMKVPERQ